jgi:cytochrome c oxidase subunit 4
MHTEHAATDYHATKGAAADHAEGQHHPIKLYLVVWGWLFILSTASYLVDYFNLEGLLRWFLIVAFMLLKAGLIVAVFMHMAWERLAFVYAILVPPLCLLVFVGIMASESIYTFDTRAHFFGNGQEFKTFAPTVKH